MTITRSFDRQVRPIRMHLAIDRSVYLCGYIQRAVDPRPDPASTPVCGPCAVAFNVLRQTYEDIVQDCRPPDIDLPTAVELLRETHSGYLLGFDLEEWARRLQPAWAAWRHGKSKF